MMKYFNILDYGVKPDCKFLQTSAFQSVIDDCRRHGGGTIVIPQGEYYLGSLRLYSNMTLLLEEEAKLYGSKNYRDYQDLNVPSTLGYLHNDYYIKLWNLPKYYIYGMICAFEAKNISIIGKKGSLIDGQDCFDENGEEKFRGPMGIIFSQCENVIMQGYTFSNSANWSHQIDSCKNVTIKDVRIIAGHDGFNLHHCQDIYICNCKLEVGDDCVAGYDIKNLLVERCYFNTACNVLRIGGNNLVFDDCKFIGPGRYPHRSTDTYDTHALFKYYALGCDMVKADGKDILIKNCELDDIDKLLVYEQGSQAMLQDNRPLRKLSFENVKILGLSKKSVFLANSEPCQLVFNNAFIDYCGEGDFLQIDDGVELILENVSFGNMATLKVGHESKITMNNCNNIKIIRGE